MELYGFDTSWSVSENYLWRSLWESFKNKGASPKDLPKKSFSNEAKWGATCNKVAIS